MRQSTSKGYFEKERVSMKRKKTLESDTRTIFAIRHTMTKQQQQASSSSCSNSSIATHYTAAAAGRYVRMHTRTIRRAAAYIIIILIDQVLLLLWNRTRCLRNKGRKDSIVTTQSSSSSAATLWMYIKPTSRMFRCHFNHRWSYIFLHRDKKRMSQKKKLLYWTRTSDAKLKGQ